MQNYTRKQPEASNDYTLAHNICNTLEVGKCIVVSPVNDKVFRKYLYEVSSRKQRKFLTRKIDESSRTITNITH